MKLGCCVSGFDQVAALEIARADYCELPVATVVMADAKAGHTAFLAEARRQAIKPGAYNILFPRTLHLVGPSADRVRVGRYVVEAVDRIAAAGGRVVVFGSGRSRSVPDGVARAEALDELERLLRWSAAEAAARGLLIVLEPLRRAESNVFNTLAECAAFVRDRRLDRVRLVADSYHMTEEHEPLAAIDAAADLVAHAHVADLGRRPPGQGAYDLTAFLRRLRLSGYRGDCSIECVWRDYGAEVGSALASLRRAAAAAGWDGVDA
jgi:sugar phosphate isomerase/epimerase